VALLAASEPLLLPEEVAAGTLFLGELSLDGRLRPTAGVLPLVGMARAQGLRTVAVPAPNAAEAALVDGIEVLPVEHLAALVAHLSGEQPIPPYRRSALPPAPPPAVVYDFAEVRGQETAKRALEIAAAGGHNILFNGPPGAGKTLLARCTPSILPDLTPEEALEVTQIYSVCGLLAADEPLVRQRPFRAPHHTISYAGLVGGGKWPRPGEISLAHRGVLFLDELPEFGEAVLQVLRQPLEEGFVTISRAAGAVTFPARFMLVAAMNPCPCGYLGDPERACACPPAAIARYRRRLSGPLLDRIDLYVEVPRVEYAKLASLQPAEPSAAIRGRVVAGWARQAARFGAAGAAQEGPASGAGQDPAEEGGAAARAPRRPITSNAEMGPAEVRRYCQVGADPAAGALLRRAMQQLHLSARSFHRLWKVARTIADLEGQEQIRAVHMAEALQYRPRLGA